MTVSGLLKAAGGPCAGSGKLSIIWTASSSRVGFGTTCSSKALEEDSSSKGISHASSVLSRATASSYAISIVWTMKSRSDFSWGLAVSKASAALSFLIRAMEEVIGRGDDEKVKSDGIGSLMSVMLTPVVESVKVS